MVHYILLLFCQCHGYAWIHTPNQCTESMLRKPNPCFISVHETTEHEYAISRITKPPGPTVATWHCDCFSVLVALRLSWPTFDSYDSITIGIRRTARSSKLKDECQDMCVKRLRSR
ncbi:hypothetical protein BDR22DRAFT_860355 [Usnea florida]